MMNFEQMQKEALEAGFSGAWAFDPGLLRFLPEVRDMCSAEKCGRYGHSWSCPPACGSLEDAKREAAAYSQGILLQTVGELEDEFDFEGMEAAAKRHKEAFLRFCARLAELGEPSMPMSAGSCTLCAKCTYPDAPCRFPEKVFPSMEARGLLVSEVCALAGAPYYYGKNKLAYTGCVLYGKRDEKLVHLA